MDKKLSYEERINRRERNREHAQKSRLKKRLLIETLNLKIQEVERENTKLRKIIQDNLPDKEKELLEDITDDTEMSILCASDIIFDSINHDYLHILPSN